MSLLEPLVAYAAKHLLATAAIGSVTVAGGAVVVEQVVVTPQEQVAAELAEDDASAPAGVDDGAITGEQAAAESPGPARTPRGGDPDGDTADGDLEGEPAAGGNLGASEDAEARDGDTTSRGRADEVHAVIDDGEVRPGSREFGQAVAEAASEGRSARRGRSTEAHGKHARKSQAPEDTETEDETADEGSSGTVAEPVETDTEDDQAAQHARGPGKNRRPAPGDEADAADDQDETSGPATSSARGRR